MNVEQTLHTLKYLPPRKSVLIESNHGLGKSQVVAQAAAEMSRLLKKPFGFIDFRLAQCEVGDLIGMMANVPEGEVRRMVFENGVMTEQTVLAHNVTIHSLAEWFPQDPDSCGYLFLDELFRAARDVQNAVFELALDYRYHFRSLPMGWRVIAASNDNMDIYSGNLPDPALYDRFLKIKFHPTVPEWLKHAGYCGVHKAITTYINKIPADLMPESKSITPGEICPSPRSWFNLSDCLIYMADQDVDPLKDENYLTLLCKGYLGQTVAVNFVDFVKKNYKIYSPKDILYAMDRNNELKEFFENIEPAECAYYSKEIVKYIGKLGELTKGQSKNLSVWLKTVNKEIASGFWSRFVGESNTKVIARKWYSDTEGVQDYIYGFLAKDKAIK